jgi:hypothetical protein
MTHLLILAFILAVPILVSLRALYRRISRFSDRDVHDVIPFVREIRLLELDELLNPHDENYLKLNLSPGQFRKVQRKRMRLLLEFVDCMSHNTAVLLDWGRTEQSRSQNSGDDDLKQLTNELIKACIEFRCGARAIQTQLHVWLIKTAIFPSATVPYISVLRKFESFDLLNSYEALKAAASQLSLAFGADYADQIGNAL